MVIALFLYEGSVGREAGRKELPGEAYDLGGGEIRNDLLYEHRTSIG
jgi:hypothetical protein